jgi:glycosyltransferase involved in cell wall biosynthesis
MPSLIYFYRHPDPMYFSLEKLFAAIGRKIQDLYGREFSVREKFLPLSTKWKSILPNLLFAKKNQGRINHITGDIHYAILACSKRNVNVLTIHDCVLLHRYSAGNPRYWIMKWLWYDLPVRKADAVTVISENTKNELLRFTRCDPRKIRVISNFVDPIFQAASLSGKNDLPCILFIGSTPNKNLERLAEAIEGINVRLEIVGTLSRDQLTVLERYRIDYRQSSGLTPESLLDKYIQCDLLAFPSTYEGFGLPIIEAQAVGRPVLTSNIAPMAGIAGGAAWLADPYDPASIRQGVLHILNDEEYRTNMIRLGLDNVNRFRLDKVTDQYVALYKELVRKKLN